MARSPTGATPSRWRGRLAVGSVVVCLSHAAATDARAAQVLLAPNQSAPVILYLELVVNAVPTGRVVPVVFHHGDYQVTADDLRAVSVRAPGEVGERVTPALLPGVAVEYEPYTQRLALRVPPDWLPRQMIGPRRDAAPTAASTLGVIVNYDLNLQATAASQQAAIWTEARVSDRWGTVATTGVARYAAAGPTVLLRVAPVRHDTTWTYAEEGRALVYAAGDVVSQSLPWTRAVRLGGFAVSRNFSIRPDLVTYPLPEFAGQAAVPTAVDLFVNGTRVESAQVSAGPFAFTHVPMVSGAGTATIVTTDVLGRAMSTELSFYVANELLRPGLVDYSVSIGWLRHGYGIHSFGYAEPAGVGTLRYGLTSFLTVDGHAEGRAGLFAGSGGADVRVGRWGVLAASAAHGQDLDRRGWQATGGYRFSSGPFSLQLQRTQRTPGFTDLSETGLSGPAAGRMPRRIDQATGGVNVGRLGTLAMAYFNVDADVGSRTRIVNLTYSRPFLWRSSLLAAVNHRVGHDNGTTGLLRVLVPIGRGGTLGVSASATAGRRPSGQVQHSRSVPPAGGLGWSLQLADGDVDQTAADLTLRTRHLQVQGGTHEAAGVRSYWTSLSGATVFMRRGVFATNRATDAFVLIDTDGYGGVPVLFEHQRIGTTNRRGYLMIPGVTSHYGATFAIDPLGLPANVRVGEVESRVAVRRQSAAIVRFGLERIAAGLVTLIDPSGRPLPVGARAVHVASKQMAPVGWDGLVYFEALQPVNDVVVQLPDGSTCRTRFAVDIRRTEIARIGPLTCRP